MNIYVLIYVCMYAFMNVRVYVCMYICTYACVCIYICMYGCMRWAGHVARMEEKRVAYRVLVEKPEGKNRWGDLGVDGE